MKRAALLMLVACGSEAPPADDCPAGQLRDGDACVDPWRHGDPTWSTCPDEPRATPESLADKAAIYDARTMALHVHPDMPWVMSTDLATGTDPETATWEDVAIWRTSENDGLWGALYMASAAYRYAATRDAAALDTLRTLLEGERLRMDITGVPGLFTRQLIPPGIAGIACPADPALYVPAPDKRGNRWVRIGDDGCAQVADATTLAFSSTTHCDLDAFAGWCFLDNVSQDEYVGHMFALGAIARLVDDAEVRGAAVELLRDIGWHLVLNDLEFTDWDGRETQWGKVHPGAAGDTPGYLAIMGLSFLAVVADATGDDTLRAYYDDLAADYPQYFDQIDVLEPPDACGSNWNNISMLAANAHHLLWHEHDPARRAEIQDAVATSLMHADSPRAGAHQRNAWLDVMWAAQKPLGPGTDGPGYALVEDAVCQLRQFPASNHRVARDPAALQPGDCTGRSDESLAEEPFDVADRCAEVFVWWKNPYDRTGCADNPVHVEQPAGFTLPYWMARYYGFIDGTL